MKMENNFSNGLEELINTLYNMVQEAWAVPLSADKCLVERERVLDILDEMKANLPGDLKTAQEIVERRNELLASGKREAEAIKKQAEEYARQLVKDDEIVVAARKKANDLISVAEMRSKELKKVANDYCDEMLKKSEDSLITVLDEIRKSRQQFRAIGASRRMPEEQE